MAKRQGILTCNVKVSIMHIKSRITIAVRLYLHASDKTPTECAGTNCCTFRSIVPPIVSKRFSTRLIFSELLHSRAETNFLIIESSPLSSGSHTLYLFEEKPGTTLSHGRIHRVLCYHRTSFRVLIMFLTRDGKILR